MEQSKPQSIVFFGSGPVAAASLAHLFKHFDIELVVTKHTPKHHKDPAPVETFAQNNNVQLLYADTKTELDTVLSGHDIDSHCGVVIDYGVIISKQVIDMFRYGIINSHFSLLPEWRGADPITFSILSGQSETGVCLMTINEGLDTGPLIAQATVAIQPDDTNTTLTDKLISASNQLLSDTLPAYYAGTIQPQPQDTAKIATYSRKLTKQDGWLNTQKPATVLAREIRAFNEWPKTKFTFAEEFTVIITKANAVDDSHAPGSINITADNHLLIGCRVGSLDIIELMPLGKQKMSTTAFLNGYRGRLQ